ncbi:hypothetical protein ACSMX9_14610 [Streptomyces sp. LE64]|uniref:hypothetical protein n=1 Tax=Streptomyces sp. LE64 TaxID=3448653 RepID=UPI004041FFEE
MSTPTTALVGTEAVTMADLSAPLRVLRLLAAEHPDLPAPCMRVSTVFPDLLDLSFHPSLDEEGHGAFGVFEAWREALGIDPGSVVHGVQGGGLTLVLSVQTVFMGARLRLAGYADAPVPVPGVGVGS